MNFIDWKDILDKDIIIVNRNETGNFGVKDGSQKGWLRGGAGRNKTDNCRHPELRGKKNV